VEEIQKKTRIKTIAEKNRIIENIIDAMLTRDNFLLVAHKNPDEDAISSMVSFGLLLNKLNKTSYIMACGDIQQNYDYLLNICKYNAISIVEQCDHLPEDVSTLILLDTAKPGMLMNSERIATLFDNRDILKIELDHHLDADSVYSGDPGYRLVTEASSTCELIGLLAFKLQKKKETLGRSGVDTVLSRNVVLAILTGIIGDSKMGRYLKTERERWFYRLFSNMFDQMLETFTYKNSANLSNMKEIYSELLRLSEEEEQCYRYMFERIKTTPFFRYVSLNNQESRYLFDTYDSDTIVSIARTIADYCAEQSGFVSLVSYYDAPRISGLIQFRMRRNQHFKRIDLRTVISQLGITDGGGHEGAIGFRVDRDSVQDIYEFVNQIIATTESMITTN
jgi:nanoRNase/pAp phosphatase (c-di-AMP/oligoRNAs hydrolase)